MTAQLGSGAYYAERLALREGEVAKPGAVQIADSEVDMFMFGGNSFLAPSNMARRLNLDQRELDIESSMRQALPGPSLAPALASALAPVLAPTV
jgi:hypothetical protein